MNDVAALVANAIAAFSVCLVLWTAVRRPTELRYAAANLLRQKRRTAVTLGSIVLGGVAIFMFGGFVEYAFWGLREQTIRTNLGHVQLYQKGYLANGSANPLKYTIADYEPVKRLLQDDPVLKPLVKAVTGQLEFSGIVSNYDTESSTFFTAVGIEPESSLLLGSFDRVVLGSDLSRVDLDGATVGAGLGRALGTTYDGALDLLAINAAGGQNAMSIHVRGVLESGVKDYDDRMLKLPLVTAQGLLETRGVSKVIVLLHDTEQAPAALARIEALIAGRGLSLEARGWSSLAVFYHQSINLFNGIFLFIKAIVSIIVVFMIGNTMTMNVLERTREIGTLRAMGLTQRAVARLFLLEGILVGLVGAALSLALGIALAEVVNLQGVPMPPSPGNTKGYLAFIRWRDNAGLFWFCLALSIVTAFVASLLPARRASRLVIAEAFRHA